MLTISDAQFLGSSCTHTEHRSSEYNYIAQKFKKISSDVLMACKQTIVIITAAAAAAAKFYIPLNSAILETTNPANQYHLASAKLIYQSQTAIKLQNRKTTQETRVTKAKKISACYKCFLHHLGCKQIRPILELPRPSWGTQTQDKHGHTNRLHAAKESGRHKQFEFHNHNPFSPILQVFPPSLFHLPILWNFGHLVF